MSVAGVLAQAAPEPSHHRRNRIGGRLPHARRLSMDRQLATDRGEALSAGHRRALLKSGTFKCAATCRFASHGVASDIGRRRENPCFAGECKWVRPPARWPSTPGRNRTCDLRFRKPALYPLSYGGNRRGGRTRRPTVKNTFYRFGTRFHTRRSIGRRSLNTPLNAFRRLRHPCPGPSAENWRSHPEPCDTGPPTHRTAFPGDPTYRD